jgi:hypothetical protein
VGVIGGDKRYPQATGVEDATRPENERVGRVHKIRTKSLNLTRYPGMRRTDTYLRVRRKRHAEHAVDTRPRVKRRPTRRCEYQDLITSADELLDRVAKARDYTVRLREERLREERNPQRLSLSTYSKATANLPVR